MMVLMGLLGGWTLTPGAELSLSRPDSLPWRLGALETFLDATGLLCPLAIAPANEPRIPPYPNAETMAGLYPTPIESILCLTGDVELTTSFLNPTCVFGWGAFLAASVIEDDAYWP